MYLCVAECMYVHRLHAGTTEARRGRFLAPGTRVTGYSELPSIGAGNQA